MTVQELIDKLQKVENKNAAVYKYNEEASEYFDVFEVTAYRYSDGDLNHTVDAALDDPDVLFIEV